MPAPINRKIILEYEEKRRRAQSEAEARRAEIYEKLPRIVEIDQEIESSGINALRSYMASSENKEQLISNLKKRNKALRSEKKKILEEAGYSEEYLKPVYECPDCQDTGISEGIRCHCLVQRMIDVAYEESGIRDVLSKNNFDTFKLDLFPKTVIEGHTISPNKNMRQLYKAALRYSDNFPENNPVNLLFSGMPGTGKTFLCDCIAKRVLDRGFTVLYLTANQLCSAFDEYHFQKNPSIHDFSVLVHDQVGEVDLLIIDDLGTEYLNQISASDLFECINQRIVKNKATLISTNLDETRLQTRYTDRLYSRLHGCFAFCEFYGPDVRTAWQKSK